MNLRGGTSGKLTIAGGRIGDPGRRTLVANVLNFDVGGVLESSGFPKDQWQHEGSSSAAGLAAGGALWSWAGSVP